MKLPALERLILQLSRQLSDEDAEQIKYRLKFSTVERERAPSAEDLFSFLRARHRTTNEFVQQLRDLLCLSETKNKEQYRDLLEQYESNNGKIGDESLHSKPSPAIAASLQSPAPPRLHHEFRRVLGQIAKSVSQKDLNMMRAILVRTESDRRSIILTEHLFEILEKRGCFDPVNTEYLHDLFDVFDDAPALRKLNMYYRNHVQPLPPPNYAPPPDTPYAASDRNIPPSPTSPLSTSHPSTPSLSLASSQPFSSNSHPHSSPANFDSRSITQLRNSIYPTDTNLYRKRPPSVHTPEYSGRGQIETPPSTKRPRSDRSNTPSDEDTCSNSPVMPSAPPPPSPPPPSLEHSSHLHCPEGNTMITRPSSVNLSVSGVSRVSYPQEEQSRSVFTDTDQMIRTPAYEVANATGSSEFVSNRSSFGIPGQQQPVDNSSSLHYCHLPGQHPGKGQHYGNNLIAATASVDVPPVDDDNSIALNESQSSNSGSYSLHQHPIDEAQDSDN